MSSGRFNLSALAVRERSITLFLIFLIGVAGTLSFFKLGRAEDPPFTVKQLTIISAWPGATAQEMQDQVAEPLEKRMQELKWYDRSETYTRAGLAFTMVSLQDKTPPSQVQEEFYQARKKVGDAAKTLPAGVIGPMVNDPPAQCTTPFRRPCHAVVASTTRATSSSSVTSAGSYRTRPSPGPVPISSAAAASRSALRPTSIA